MQSVLYVEIASAISKSSNVSSGFKNTKGYFTGIKVCHTLYYHIEPTIVIQAAYLGLE